MSRLSRIMHSEAVNRSSHDGFRRLATKRTNVENFKTWYTSKRTAFAFRMGRKISSGKPSRCRATTAKNEPLEMSTLVSLAGVGLAALLLIVCACIYAVRTEKCCFARKGDFKPSDLNGEKMDIEKNATGPGGIPADAIYTTTPRGGRGHSSPEAMKQTTQTFNGRSRLEEQKRKEIDYGGLKTRTLSSNIYNSDTYETDRDYYIENDLRNTRPYRSLNNKYNTVGESVEGVTYFGASANCQTEKYQRRSLPPQQKRYKSNRERPKPLQPDCERYYDQIFPKESKMKTNHSQHYYQPNSLDHAEL